ncbi:MAG: hypothetical protein QX191_00455 [Methylococcaceae bacterium]
MNIISKVVENYRQSTTQLHYGDSIPMLGLENVMIPRINTIQGEELARLFVYGELLSSVCEISTVAYFLRTKGWPLISTKVTYITEGKNKRTATCTKYVLYAELTLELTQRMEAHVKSWGRK